MYPSLIGPSFGNGVLPKSHQSRVRSGKLGFTVAIRMPWHFGDADYCPVVQACRSSYMDPRCLCCPAVCANNALVRRTGGVVSVFVSAFTVVLARGDQQRGFAFRQGGGMQRAQHREGHLLHCSTLWGWNGYRRIYDIRFRMRLRPPFAESKSTVDTPPPLPFMMKGSARYLAIVRARRNGRRVTVWLRNIVRFVGQPHMWVSGGH